MSNNKINRPWSSQIELTFGCDNRCPMCYKQVLEKKVGEYNFMSVRMASEIARKMVDAGWNGIRLEFAMRGEPFLNPHFFEIIRLFRHTMDKSQIMVTTNGNKLDKNSIMNFFRSGGNILLVDCYDNNISKRKEFLRQNKIPFTDYYEDDFNPYCRHNVSKTRMVCLMDDIKTKSKVKQTRILHNLAGNVDFNRTKYYGLYPLEKPLEKKCVNPFREIIFTYNGTIPICCQDGGVEQVLGSIYEIKDLSLFWTSDNKLNRIRKALYNKRRDLVSPCNVCDSSGGVRQGILPDMGSIDD